MKSRVSRVIAVGIASALLAGCGNHTVVPNPNMSTANRRTEVAVMGDTPSQVQKEILAARASGMQPDYITVRIQSQIDADLTGQVINSNSRFGKWHVSPVTAKAGRSYVFPVYAQVLRTTHALIVRAYNATYVFRLADVSLTYGDANSAIGIDTLPAVTANYFENIAASNVPTGSFAAGNVREKEALCPDCVALRLVPSVSTAIAANWNSKTDSWQDNPTYTPWHSGSSPIKPMFSNHPQPGPCGSQLSGGTVATSNGSCSGISSGGITGNPGPSFSGYKGGCRANPSSCLSLIPPTPGAQCDGSQLTLGSQWPVNTTDSGHQVDNIIAMSANNAAGVPEIAAWEYVTPDGTYIQGNTSMKTFWTGLAESIPGLGSLIQNMDSGGIVSVNSSQASQMLNYVDSHSGKSGSCFTHSLA